MIAINKNKKAQYNVCFVYTVQLLLFSFFNPGPQHFDGRRHSPTGGAEHWSSGPSGGVSALSMK